MAHSDTEITIILQSGGEDEYGYYTISYTNALPDIFGIVCIYVCVPKCEKQREERERPKVKSERGGGELCNGENPKAQRKATKQPAEADK